MLPDSAGGGGRGAYQTLPEHTTWATMTKTSRAQIFRITVEHLRKFQGTGKKFPFFPGAQAQGPVQ